MKTITKEKEVDKKATRVAQAYIDGKAYPFTEGETILAFVRRHRGEKSIPTLCDAPNLEPFGSCRICSVDISVDGNGHIRTVASCHTPVQAGMKILPHSKNVQRLRKNIMELVLTDHPLDCLTCEVNGNCECSPRVTNECIDHGQP